MRPHHRRPVLRRIIGPVDRPHLPRGGLRRTIGLIEDGDRIFIDVKTRASVLVDDEVLAERPRQDGASERPWQPKDRVRPVTMALRAYAKMATSADKVPCVRSTDQMNKNRPGGQPMRVRRPPAPGRFFVRSDGVARRVQRIGAVEHHPDGHRDSDTQHRQSQGTPLRTRRPATPVVQGQPA